LFLYQGTQQGIYYEVDGNSPNRQTTFEFFLSSYGDPTKYYHFLVKFFEDRLNVVTFQYLKVSDHGVSATVGVEMFSGMLFKTSYSLIFLFSLLIQLPSLFVTAVLVR
jgi:hypothetical protein